MTLIALVGISVLAACVSGQQYADFDYQGQGLAPQRSAPSVGLSRAAAAQIKPTPVPIIKQINRHNDDGSYTYGYEGADGSFKIETKLPTGEVSGKYGYVDDTGKLRVVDYGANKYGFQPAGEGITVAPPTLVDETTDRTKPENAFAEYDEDAVLYARPQPQPVARPVARQPKRPRPAPQRPVFAPEPQYVTYEAPQQRTASPVPLPAPTPLPVQQFQQIPQQIAPQHIPQQIPQHIQQQIQQQIPQQIPQQIQQQIPQQQAQFPQTFITYESQPRAAPAHAQRAPAPAPARAVVPSSVPSGPLFRPNVLPAPAQVRPAPVRETPAVRAPAPAPAGSVLDSLIQQYALPQGVGQPLHDISFGSFASQTRF